MNIIDKTINIKGEIATVRCGKKEDHMASEFWPSIGEYPIYDEFLYVMMTNDLIRNKMYESAIKHEVSGKVVLDIGTGRDMNWALMALKYGAKKVYAIEVIKSSYEMANAKLKKLGHGDRVQLIYGNAKTVDLPEKVDVCVSEIIGMIGGSEGAEAILDDARLRFLKPQGKMIPDVCETLVAAYTLPDNLYDNPTFNEFPLNYLEMLFKHCQKIFDPVLCISNVDNGKVLSNSGIFESLRFNEDPANKQTRNETLEVTSKGRLDGLLLWLNLKGVNNGDIVDSLVQQTNWLPVYVPLFYPGIAVGVGDCLNLEITKVLSADNIHPEYRISGDLTSQGKAKITIEAEVGYNGSSQNYSNDYFKKLIQMKRK
ncbi:MAG: class I SAM-dependent methyltransferase [Algicola sp.]|nr:class I SAM-dependent methyltransferase [Algicola sp.]